MNLRQLLLWGAHVQNPVCEKHAQAASARLSTPRRSSPGALAAQESGPSE